MWSGALRLRPIKRSSESRNPSVWRSGRLKTTRSVNAVRTARFEYRRWPPRRPFFGGIHAAIASSLSQIVTSPRLLRPRSYSLQFRILCFVLYWRLTRLDFAATMTLPPISMMDWTPPPPLACSLTPIHAPTPLGGDGRDHRLPVGELHDEGVRPQPRSAVSQRLAQPTWVRGGAAEL